MNNINKSDVYDKMKSLIYNASKMTQDEKKYYVKFFDMWLDRFSKNKYQYEYFYNALENWIKALYLFMSKSSTLMMPLTGHVIEYLDLTNEDMKIFCLDLMKN